MSGNKSTSVLIVCLGNICRSPMGEAVLRHTAKQRGVDIVVDSAGTGAWHIGEDPDDRAVGTCKKYKIPINHKGRELSTEDFRNFTYILAADNSNLRNILARRPKGSKAEVALFGSYAGGGIIEDPYYGDDEAFETCYEQCIKFSEAFLDHLQGNRQT